MSSNGRLARLADVLVGYSARVGAGDLVMIEASELAEPLVLAREHDAAPIHHDQRVFHEPASAEPRKGCPDGEGAHGAPAAWASRMADSRASTPFLAPV